MSRRVHFLYVLFSSVKRRSRDRRACVLHLACGFLTHAADVNSASRWWFAHPAHNIVYYDESPTWKPFSEISDSAPHQTVLWRHLCVPPPTRFATHWKAWCVCVGTDLVSLDWNFFLPCNPLPRFYKHQRQFLWKQNSPTARLVKEKNWTELKALHLFEHFTALPPLSLISFGFQLLSFFSLQFIVAWRSGRLASPLAMNVPKKKLKE